MAKRATSAALKGLNREQREAVQHGMSPLLIVAGAGTGKTNTLAHRVAHLIEQGVDPERLLLLTFTRRAAREMLHRTDGLLSARKRSRRAGAAPLADGRVWGGTFHAIASRLLRIYGKAIGLDPSFSIYDRGDSEDLMEVLREELGLATPTLRFPKKGTCMAIYSRCVNAQEPIARVLQQHFAWCESHVDDLKRLFDLVTDRKEESAALDFDDLLLFLDELLADDQLGGQIRDRFDAVLVDEYQDTNRLQAEILRRLRPDGVGLTVVGDDAQSIYSFRAASVRNILDFPDQFPDTTVVKLEQNYRSTQPILEATNCVIAGSQQRYAKELWSNRDGGERPLLATCDDEDEQAEFVIRKVLEHFDAGIPLREQAVLFRAGHNAMVLEAALAHHGIPFVKYGGLRFVETAHVKDLMAFLRLAENYRDQVAGTRLLTLLPGVGSRKAAQWMHLLADAEGDFRCWQEVAVPAASQRIWPSLVRLLRRLAHPRSMDLTAQVAAIRRFYAPLMEAKYDQCETRIRDLEQLELVAERFTDRRRMVAEIALDPPGSAQEADAPESAADDTDVLVLSTVHSAKGLEWKVVFVIGATDASFPSVYSSSDSELLEEERRLLYVALTRARDWLCVCFPMRGYRQASGRSAGDAYRFTELSRFITSGVKRRFRKLTVTPTNGDEEIVAPPHIKSHQVRQRARSMWK